MNPHEECSFDFESNASAVPPHPPAKYILPYVYLECKKKLEKNAKNTGKSASQTEVCIFEGKSVKSMCRTEYGKGNEGEERKSHDLYGSTKQNNVIYQ